MIIIKSVGINHLINYLKYSSKKKEIISYFFHFLDIGKGIVSLFGYVINFILLIKNSLIKSPTDGIFAILNFYEIVGSISKFNTGYPIIDNLIIEIYRYQLFPIY